MPIAKMKSHPDEYYHAYPALQRHLVAINSLDPETGAKAIKFSKAVLPTLEIGVSSARNFLKKVCCNMMKTDFEI